MAVFTRGTIWAETDQIAFTNRLFLMSKFAFGSKTTKTLKKSCAFICGRFLIKMQINTISTIVTLFVVRPKVTSRHSSQIISMKKFAISILFAETVQPMFTHCGFFLDM